MAVIATFGARSNPLGSGSSGKRLTNNTVSAKSIAPTAPAATFQYAPTSFTQSGVLNATDTRDASYYGGSGVTAAQQAEAAAAAQRTADERAAYDDQINAINQLFGLTETQRDAGLTRLNNSYAQQTARLGEQKTKTMQGYDQQSVQNGQDKQRGVESVDAFANNSFNSLNRLLQGANAGSSTVARDLIPYLISKGAGTRRTGVFETAGKNDQAIASARGDAEDQFRYSEEDLGNQRKSQEQQFREGILNKQNDLLNQRRTLEMQRAQASGAGYDAAKAAAAASQAGINDRMAQLSSLFGQFAPTFNARAVNTQAPELGQFTVDPAQIRADGNLPVESRYYLPQLKKRQEGIV